MTPQFHERYISRAEHNAIVAYYKKLVVQLHQNRQTVKDESHLSNSTCTSCSEKLTVYQSCEEVEGVDLRSGGNVVVVDFARYSAKNSQSLE
jgi:hypothetical protein